MGYHAKFIFSIHVFFEMEKSNRPGYFYLAAVCKQSIFSALTPLVGHQEGHTGYTKNPL